MIFIDQNAQSSPRASTTTQHNTPKHTPYAKIAIDFYTILPKLPENLTGADQKVHGCLSTYRNEFTGVAWPAIITIANKTGLSERQVKRSIKKLVRLGILIFTGKIHGNGTKEYFVDTRMPLKNGAPLPVLATKEDKPFECATPIHPTQAPINPTTLVDVRFGQARGDKPVTARGDKPVTARGDRPVTPGVTNLSPEPPTELRKNNTNANPQPGTTQAGTAKTETAKKDVVVVSSLSRKSVTSFEEENNPNIPLAESLLNDYQEKDSFQFMKSVEDRLASMEAMLRTIFNSSIPTNIAEPVGTIIPIETNPLTADTKPANIAEPVGNTVPKETNPLTADTKPANIAEPVGNAMPKETNPLPTQTIPANIAEPVGNTVPVANIPLPINVGTPIPMEPVETTRLETVESETTKPTVAPTVKIRNGSTKPRSPRILGQAAQLVESSSFHDHELFKLDVSEREKTVILAHLGQIDEEPAQEILDDIHARKLGGGTINNAVGYVVKLVNSVKNGTWMPSVGKTRKDEAAARERDREAMRARKIADEIEQAAIVEERNRINQVKAGLAPERLAELRQEFIVSLKKQGGFISSKLKEEGFKGGIFERLFSVFLVERSEL